MFCENLQFNLSLYSDDVLSDDERFVLDEHLAECPLCRIKLSDYQDLRQNLRVMPRPEIPQNLLQNIRTSVAQAQQTNETGPIFVFKENAKSWWRTHLMSYSIGTFASVFFGLMLLWGMFPGQAKVNVRYNSSENSTMMLADDGSPMTSSEYANKLISYQAPTINPSGALAAMSKSIIRGKMTDDEVVVVADVFSNGLAKISEVVEPQNDRRAVRELEKALKTDPAYAAPPFVTAETDNRSETVRVVLKIQRVDVPVN